MERPHFNWIRARAIVLAGGLVGTVSLWSERAHADETAAAATTTVDVVILRNGAALRGHIKELVPDDHVTMTLEDGETRSIVWSEIERLTVGGSQNDPQSAVGPDAIYVPRPELPPMLGPVVRVHVDSPRQVSLYRKPEGFGTFVHVCASPCDVDVPIGDIYRVQGTDVRASEVFRLGDREGTAVVAVDGSSLPGMVAGIVLIASGSLAAFIGSIALLDKSSRASGAIAFVVGVTALVGGILIYKTSARTDVSQPTTNRTKASSGAILDAFRRDPEWMTMPSLSEPWQLALRRRELPTSSSAASAVPALVPVLFERTF
jgi:hypothetical protein